MTSCENALNVALPHTSSRAQIILDYITSIHFFFYYFSIELLSQMVINVHTLAFVIQFYADLVCRISCSSHN